MFAICFVLISFVSVLLNINLVSALDLRVGSEQLIDLVIDFGEPFIKVILGGEDYTGFLLFEKLLIFLILLGVIFIALKNVSIFEDNPPVLWLVSGIIPVLAVRFMDITWINTIIFQYTVLGIALAGILPFIIYLFFLHSVSDNSTVRKIGWIFFIVVYFFLWATTENSETYGSVYFWTMLISLIFLLLDKTIHTAYMRQSLKQGGSENKYNHIMKLRRDIREAKDALQHSEISRSAANRLIKSKQKKIDWFLKH